MPQSKPNQFARVVAVGALAAAFVLVVVTIATSGGSDSGGSDGGDEDTSGVTKKGERALENGVWVVGEGDTLVSIAEETGMDTDELIALNPEIDPQILTTGQRISLRAGVTGSGGDAEAPDASQSPTPSAEEAGGSGVGDDGPTGAGSGTSDGVDSN